MNDDTQGKLEMKREMNPWPSDFFRDKEDFWEQVIIQLMNSSLYTEFPFNLFPPKSDTCRFLLQHRTILHVNGGWLPPGWREGGGGGGGQMGTDRED